MTLKNMNEWLIWKPTIKPTKLNENCDTILSIESKSMKLNIQNLEECSYKRHSALKVYLKHVLPCDLLRLSLSILLLLMLILFIKQSNYTLTNIEQIKAAASLNEVDLNYIKYTIVENSDGFVETENQEYKIIIFDEVFPSTQVKQCSNIPDAMKFDCHPEEGASELSCGNRGCCWDALNRDTQNIKRYPLNVPYCFYPKDWSLYKTKNVSHNGNSLEAFAEQIANSPYKKDVPLVKMEMTDISSNIARVKIYDPMNKRYEPLWPVRSNSKLSESSISNVEYKFQEGHTAPGFKVTRRQDGTVLFDCTNAGGFIFADQFLQITFVLPSHNIYGLGEHRSSLKLNTTWKSFTTFNKDQPPTEDANLYGAHPFFLVMEDTGRASGALFLNSNAMDIILQPAPAITFRTIGGIFDMYYFMGPTPADVIRQYSEIVGKPFLPPYWSLGFHLCRFGYRSLENTIKVWNRTRAAGIPLDTQWNDLDYMDKNNDFTYNRNTFKNLPQFVEHLHSLGMHYIPLIDAGVSASETNGTYLPYDEGVKEGVFVKEATNDQPFIGKVWNYVSTVWPDFTNPKTKDYYLRMMQNLHKNFPYDGAWIDMNEPSNFYNGHKNGCSANDLDYPEYVPNVVSGVLATKTLCMNAKHYAGSHYNIHSTYGTSQAIATNYALTKIRQKRPFIISRSTWVGHGVYAGHWSGDVYSSWHDLKMSIPEILTFNFYQIPMMGADICGFDGNTTASLCNRWMQLGAFYPFSRNHNSDDTIEQDPVALGDLVVKSSKRALTIRYWLLPYLYTLFFRAHKFGDTVVRPLFFEFPNDTSTYDIDTQFLWGSSFMIVPVLEPNKTSVNAYLPRGLWYDLYTKKPILGIGKYYSLDAPMDTIPLMIRGGSILPAQKPGVTTTESRKNDFHLIVALDDKQKAKGQLYWDDGDSLDSYEAKQFLWWNFSVERGKLFNTEVESTNFDPKLILDKVEILGITSRVNKVFLNKRSVQFTYDVDGSYLSVTGLNINLNKRFTLQWT